MTLWVNLFSNMWIYADVSMKPFSWIELSCFGRVYSRNTSLRLSKSSNRLSLVRRYFFW